MKSISTTEIGHRIEDVVLTHLEKQGLRLVTRNYACRQGEIDIIMRDNDVLVFIEVRFRKADRFGSPLESVTHTKRNRIIQTARHYLYHHHFDGPCRFDVVAVMPDNKKYKIEWINDAFEC